MLITLLSLASLSVPHLCSRQPNSLFPKPSTSPSRLSPPLASLSVPDTLSPLASLSPEVPSPLASLSPEVPLLLRISPPSANHSKRNQGSAEVLYTRRSDAFGAFKKYNNVLLDGKPMKIEIVGANPVVPISARMNVTGANGKKKRTFAMIPGLGGGRGAAVNNRGFGVHSRHQGGGDISTGTRNGRGRAPGRGHGRGRGRGKNQPGEKSVDELDKELESYHAEAMQT